jgi:drug/metabolite transporter (DMT)-like permease
MIITYLIALISPAAHGAGNIIDAHMATKVFTRESTLAFYFSITNFLFLPTLFLFGMPKIVSAESFLLLGIISAISVLYMFPYFRAYKELDTSTVQALFSLGRIAIPVLAFFVIGETLSFRQYVAFAIIIAASLALSYTPAKGRIKISTGFWMMAFVAIILAIASVLEKKALNSITWIDAVFWIAVFSNITVIMFLLHGRMRRDIIKMMPEYFRNFHRFMVIELLNTAACFASMYALSLLPVTIKKSLNSTQPLFTLMWIKTVPWLSKGQPNEDFSRRAVIKKIVLYTIIIGGIVLTVL